MTVSAKVNITTKDAFEQSVYAQFPASLHQHVEHELFYHSVDLEQGEMTQEEFMQGVLATAVSHEQWLAQLEDDTAIFEGIKVLIDDGVFKNASQVAELTQELARGDKSLLWSFICCQPVENSLDAALSFLAWKHMKAIVELEADFSVSMDHFHSAKAPEFFGTSESSMALMNFSVMSQ